MFDVPQTFAVMALVYFASFFVKGALGVGSVTPTTLFGAMFVEPHHAVSLALFANFLSQLQFVRSGLRDGDWAITRRILVPNFAFAALGVWIFGRIDAPLLSFLLGALLGALVILDISNVLVRLARATDVTRPSLVFLLSAVSGLVSGVTGAGGLLIVAVYLRLILTDKQRFRGTILLLSTLVVCWRTSVMVAAGHIDGAVLKGGLLLLPFVILGGFVGTRVFGRISEARFGLLLKAVILFGAAVLLHRGGRVLLGLG